ncbi:2-keto-4-pentenoate hydratase [Thermus scotoductus]|uniref:2-hydroxypenta-2,4-dienoate hydratase n=1 Tax=Thermus scotoductus TaxID=37636 RepID=A0A430VTZ6_THESC|nr:fumarylacetoacetate hydrolase family protein [Thermus scotoductus]RTG97529.1 2-hydroxypenta-2,4-dienoate hydratase [Thermus scotoductus]RTH05982.1 2-hydroxypenta-2,4-dienoate hydratase [Thermus scotoductus]RTH16877.1 2-hydroxypenta-2,4-dienoate hydratase [Thermus scotoductus]RTI02051.1 2-hydroxypenta-2,4-dienoate hydratase [Thermus scotoductus]RTI24380.1 2-hydroxypenta-2,4-dienoate hydratase [Thermus scotoductus]
MDFAEELEGAWRNRIPIPPLSERGLEGLEAAYRVQLAWHQRRLAAGDKSLGHKIGLTSKAVQAQLGVDQPDFGHLWASRFLGQGQRLEAPASPFLQPRVEGELAFLIGKRIEGPHVTPQEVLAKTEALAFALEVVDSRIANWRIRIEDTVADNASFGAFALAPWEKALLEEDLATLGLMVVKNGRVEAQGLGAACLGHPAQAVAWLANALAPFGEALEPGEVVLSGAWAPVVPVGPGDLIHLLAPGGRSLVLRFT